MSFLSEHLNALIVAGILPILYAASKLAVAWLDDKRDHIAARKAAREVEEETAGSDTKGAAKLDLALAKLIAEREKLGAKPNKAITLIEMELPAARADSVRPGK